MFQLCNVSLTRLSVGKPRAQKPASPNCLNPPTHEFLTTTYALVSSVGGYAALHLAAAQGHTGVVALLLSRRTVDPDIRTGATHILPHLCHCQKPQLPQQEHFRPRTFRSAQGNTIIPRKH